MIINGQEADIPDNVETPTTYQVADIRNPQDRKTSFSKTILLPATGRNNEIFDAIWDVTKSVVSTIAGSNYTPDFNPNLKADVEYFVDGSLQFKGFLRLLKINIEDNVPITYEVNLSGTLADLYKSLNDRQLSELDLSEYDHTLNQTNQSESWDTRIQKDGANYVNFSGAAETGFTNGPPTGEGYVYPLQDNGENPNETTFRTNKLFPAVYAKQYVDKLFEAAGFTYTSNHFDSASFKKRIIPYSAVPLELTALQVTEREFDVDISSNVNDSFAINYEVPFGFPPDQGIHKGDDTTEPVPYDNENSDAGANYDNTTFIARIVNRAQYSFEADLDVPYTVNTPAGTVFSQGTITSVLSIENLTGGFTIASDVVTSSTLSGTHQLRINTPSYWIDAGDEIAVRLRITLSWAFHSGATASSPKLTDASTVDFTLNAANSKFIMNNLNGPLQEGDTVELNRFIPPGVTCVDYMRWLILMDNLEVKPDPDDEKNLIIEPYPQTITLESVDWSDKVDHSKPFEIVPVGEVVAKNYVFRYKPDKDYYAEKYRLEYETEYGEYIHTVDNDFAAEKKVVELGFSATLPVGTYLSDIVVPKYVKETSVGSGVFEPLDCNIRILHYGGMLSGDWTHQTDLGADTNRTTYPYAGHLDNPTTPTLDLLFDAPEKVYWGSASGIGANYTDVNRYNVQYRQYIEEITDINSKLILAWINLLPIDIQELDFSKLVFIDNVFYRLNRIRDYNANDENTTLVELSKRVAGRSFATFSRPRQVRSASAPAGGRRMLEDSVISEGGTMTGVDGSTDYPIL